MTDYLEAAAKSLARDNLAECLRNVLRHLRREQRAPAATVRHICDFEDCDQSVQREGDLCGAHREKPDGAEVSDERLEKALAVLNPMLDKCIEVEQKFGADKVGIGWCIRELTAAIRALERPANLRPGEKP